MRPIFYDTETTGTKPTKDRIIEIAAYDPQQERTFCSFVNPQCPIPPEASSISHITDDMVQGAPLFAQIGHDFAAFCGTDCVLIAHNNDAFDQLFLEAEYARASLPMPRWTFIDSLKWSRKYRSDLPRHSLQTLREHFGIAANQAHRALDDVFVLHQVFSHLVGDLDLATILELLSQPTHISRMPFGKHQGKPLAEVPKDYVAWLAQSGAFEKKENAPLKEAFVQLGRLP
jgi:DNA polymerase-3 subunit epsilon